MRNVEIKARMPEGISRDEICRLAMDLALKAGSSANQVTIEQVDTFFKCNAPSRMKLRYQTVNGAIDKIQLICYDRNNQTGPKLCDFVVCPVNANEYESMKKFMENALGTVGQVAKTRILVIIGQTRCHVDRVEGLGDFVELEVVLSDEQSIQDGETIAHSIMAGLGIPETALVAPAYMDLILANKKINGAHANGAH